MSEEPKTDKHPKRPNNNAKATESWESEGGAPATDDRSPAMAAGVTKRLWEMGDVVDVLEAWEATARHPAQY